MSDEKKIEPDNSIRASHPNGHFYSPVVDPDEIRADFSRLWPTPPPATLPGIDLNDSYHREVLNNYFAKYIDEFDYPEHGEEDSSLKKFYIRNTQFSWLDARSLFVLLREWKPKRIFEIGSGYSTVLMDDVNRRFLNEAVQITAIEPYPRPFLRSLKTVSLMEKKVQQLRPEDFDVLDDGDILFIDSSHVSKTGSDVNFLYLEILPRLKKGVRIHVHDIFFPLEYLPEWVIDENRSWNEQYILQALLIFSSKFRFLFGSMNSFVNHKSDLGAALKRPIDKIFGGGSVWLEVYQ